MSVRLRPEDRRALDLLLDRGAAAAGNGKNGAIYASPHGVSQQRVRSVEKVLQLLEVLPAAEPPRDLVARTLERVRTGRRARAVPEAVIHLDRPVV